MHSVAELDRHALALAEEQGTPFFLFSEGALAERIDQIRGAFDQVEIAYSVKTNYELGLLRRIQQFGCGASVGGTVFHQGKASSERLVRRREGHDPAILLPIVRLGDPSTYNELDGVELMYASSRWGCGLVAECRTVETQHTQ